MNLCQQSGAAEPKPRSHPARGMFPPAGVVLFLAMALLCLGNHFQAAEAAALEYEPAPLAQDHVQQDWVRRTARETQERHRLRVTLPQAAAADMPEAVQSRRAPSAIVASGQQSGVSRRDLLLGALLCLVLVVAIFKFAPERAYALLTGARPRPAGGLTPELAAKARSDEQAFAQFLASFKAGPGRASGPPAPAECVPAPAPKQEIAVADEPETDPAKAFLHEAPKQLDAARQMLKQAGEATEQEVRRDWLRELYEQLCTLRAVAGLAQSLPAWQVASASEWLVKQLAERPAKATSSALRTVGDGLSLLSDLSQPGLEEDLCTNPPVRFLAVDDDSISRHAVTFSLKKAFNEPDVAANGEAAMALAEGLAYDVIFLDVMMPGMDGFELCSKIRRTRFNGKTPVVFVTCNDNPDNRSKCAACGGTDLLGKPFLTFEITLKALTLALRGRLDARAGGEKRNLEPAIAPRPELVV